MTASMGEELDLEGLREGFMHYYAADIKKHRAHRRAEVIKMLRQLRDRKEIP